MLVFKAVKKRSKVLQANVGYGFMIAHLLKLKGIDMTKGSTINMQAYLFRTLIKVTKKKIVEKAAATEGSESSNLPLTQVVAQEKCKRNKKEKNSYLLRG